MASVVPRVKMTHSGEGALMKRATFSRARSYSLRGALGERMDAAMDVGVVA